VVLFGNFFPFSKNYFQETIVINSLFLERKIKRNILKKITTIAYKMKGYLRFFTLIF